ncbi:MAG: hypothetical protein R3A79_06865 [Nannocystaceae bacterium]
MTMPREGRAVDVAKILTIDVDAELRKLSTAQLQGPWQLPAELVRRSVGAGASRIEVRFGRKRVRVDDDGAALDPASLRALVSLLDPRVPRGDRHAALDSLENSGSIALLALAGLELDALSLTTAGADGRGHQLDLRRGKAPTLGAARRGAAPGTRIELSADGLDLGRARSWLADVTRFVGAKLVVDGAPAADGLRDYLVSAPLHLDFGARAPLRGHLAIPRSGDTPRLWILHHGVVVTHQGLTKAPTFEAILELGALVGPRSTAADLRELVAPALPRLADESVALMLQAAERLPQMGAAAQRRLLSLLLQAGRLGRRRRDIEQAPLVPCLVAHDEPHVWRSIAALREQARGEGGPAVIPALYPSQASGEVILGGGAVAILDAAARSMITELFGLRFRPPPRQLAQAGLGGRLRDLGDRLSDLVGSVAAALHLGVGPALPDAMLSKAERRLVEHLRAVIPSAGPDAPQEVVLCRGRGRVRQTRSAPRRLLLPRDNPEVRACVRAVAVDEAWVYPASVALLGGRGLPSTGARATWLRRSGA